MPDETRPDAGCPSEARLSAFALGDLVEEELERLAEHVDGCAECGSALDGFDRDGDDLVRALGGLSDSDDGAVAERVPRELESAARAARASDGLTVDCGRKFARALADGAVMLDRFELQEELGHGSFGYVFRAHDSELDRTVAIKVQRAGTPESDEEDERFLREAKSAAQLEHPGIVTLFETGRTDDGAAYLVTEFVEGETLERRLEGEPIPAGEAARLVAEIAAALQYAHEHGVIHRDLKPSNILLDRGSHPHVLDFGLAKLEASTGTMTPDGEVMGTPAYMSPEQARGESHDVDARSDVYSMGVILYELLTGGPPFQGNRRMLMLQVLEDDPRPPRRLNERVPRDLETICLKAMAKMPAGRYASAGALADDLRRFLAGEPIQARPITWIGRLHRWSWRNPLAAGVVLAVFLGSGAGWIYLTRLTDSLVRRTALHSARLQAEMLEEVNTFYSELVDGLDDVVTVTHEYAIRENALPLPATFTIAAGERISASASGMHVRLYSDHPWPWREAEGGPRDDFERRALAALRADPEGEVHEFSAHHGRPALRYAKARRMQESCLGCHNHDPRSPKNDWEIGDVRGVLEIIRPLENDVASTRSGLRGTFALATATTALLLAVTVLGLAFGRRGRSRSR